MDNVSVRELRNNGGRVLQRVASGETLTVTMDGHPIAELRPLVGRGLAAATLLQRWRRLPPVDAQSLRVDSIRSWTRRCDRSRAPRTRHPRYEYGHHAQPAG